MSNTAECELLCPRCGPVQVAASQVSCGVDAGGLALCSADCPGCSLPILVRTSPKVAEMVLWFGGAADAPVPLELLESHTGPPVTWDDVLDLHLALAGAAVPR